MTPAVRYYSQSAAWFYHNPPAGSGYVSGQPYSMDTRLSAFGAFTVGVTVGKVLADGWSVDLRADYYQQRSSYRIGGGSPVASRAVGATMLRLITSSYARGGGSRSESGADPQP